jgi:hypothetical protein
MYRKYKFSIKRNWFSLIMFSLSVLFLEEAHIISFLRNWPRQTDTFMQYTTCFLQKLFKGIIWVAREAVFWYYVRTRLSVE